MKMLLPDLKDKNILITGGTRGIGKETTRKFLEQGGRVIALARSDANLNSLRKELSEYTDRLKCIQCDLARPDEIAATCREIDAIDILIHNAGYFKASLVVDTSDEEFARHIEVNLTAAFLLVRNLWNKLKKAANPNIVFISSLAGVANVDKFPTASAYTASKMGLVGLAEVIAAEGKDFNLRCNVLSPGGVDTDMLRENFPDFEPPFKPGNIASYILFYASSESAPVTGTNVVIKA